MPKRNAFWMTVGIFSVIVGAFSYDSAGRLFDEVVSVVTMLLGVYTALRHLPMGGDDA